MNQYLDKQRYSNFLNQSNNLESNIESQSGVFENYANELYNSKVASASAAQNGRLGTEMFLSSLPMSVIEAQSIFGKVKNLYAQGLEAKDAITKAGNTIADTITGLPDKLEAASTQISDNVGTTLSGLKDTFTGIGEDMTGNITGALGDLQTTGMNAVSDIASSVKDGISSSIDNVQSAFQGGAGEIANNTKVFMNPAYEGDEVAESASSISSVSSGMIDSVQSTFGSVKNYIGGQVGEMGSMVPVLPNPSEFGLAKVAMPKIPTEAVTEAGAEASESLSGAVSGVADSVSGGIGAATDAASGLGEGLLSTGAELAGEALLPGVGEVLMAATIATSLYTGIKDLFEGGGSKAVPPPPPPPPAITGYTNVVSQAGI